MMIIVIQTMFIFMFETFNILSAYLADDILNKYPRQGKVHIIDIPVILIYRKFKIKSICWQFCKMKRLVYISDVRV